eukprot:2740524-Lingulodinium_polyedra.AAC.1
MATSSASPVTVLFDPIPLPLPVAEAHPPVQGLGRRGHRSLDFVRERRPGDSPSRAAVLGPAC